MPLDTKLQDRLSAYETLFGPLEELEWSGSIQGPGSGPMSSGDDGTEYPSCPICNGLEKPNGDFIESAVGHRSGCKLASVLNKPTRPLKPGEQARLAF